MAVVEQLDPESAATVLHGLPSRQQADLLGGLTPGGAEAILAAMPDDEASSAAALAGYEHDVAGGLMRSEFLAYRETKTVADVVEDLRRNTEHYRKFDIQYVFMTDQGGRLIGVLRLRDLLLASSETPIREIAMREPVSIRDDDSLDAVREFFDQHPFLGAPVVDAQGRLLGVLGRGDLQRAAAEQSTSDYRKSQGIIGGEELRTMPLALRSRRRLSWLSVNIVLNIIAASVIAMFQETLAAVIALAVFIPVISDMSGCSGNQAVAVSIRELTLGVIRGADALYVLGKEVLVGVINGLVLGAVIAAIAWLWKGNPFLGLVVGIAMAVNTIVSVSIGGMVPLILKRLRVDPALASGPILTTVTDMCGFFILLGLATLLLPKLVG